MSLFYPKAFSFLFLFYDSLTIIYVLLTTFFWIIGDFFLTL